LGQGAWIRNGEWEEYAKYGGFCSTEVGYYNIWIVVLVDLKQSSEILIVKRVTLLLETIVSKQHYRGRNMA
jgi:hypothetical protein